MERNHNEQTITMAIEVYQNLLGMADRNKYTTSKIERHVRKFNPYLQPTHQEKVKKFEKERSDLIRKARKFYHKNAGKFVYSLVNMGGGQRDDTSVYIRVQVKRISKDRYTLDVIAEKDLRLGRLRYAQVTVSNLFVDIPDDYFQGHGRYNDLFIKKNSAYEKDQIQRDEWEREDSKKREVTEFNTPREKLVESVT